MLLTSIRGAGAALRGRPLLLFALLLLAVRALFLVAALDPSEARVMETFDALGVEWPRGPQRPVYDSEELYYGSAAQAIRGDIGIPIFGYRFNAFAQGTMILAPLTVPLFVLFGPHYLAFKLIPLTITVLCGCGWFAVVRAWLGEKAAWLFGLLFLFAPSTLVRTGLSAHSSHPEALALLGGVFYLATRATRAGGAGARDRWALAAGVLSGLSVFVTYAVLPVLLGVGAMSLLLTRLRPLRSWLAYGVGALIGLLPWLEASSTAMQSSVEVYGRGLAELFGSGSWSRLGILVSKGFLVNYDLPGGPAPRALVGWTFLLIVIVGWIGLVRSGRRTVALLALGGTAIHLAAFVFRAPDASPRYVVPAYGFLLLSVVASAWITRRPTRWRHVPYMAVLVIGLLAQATVVGRSSFPALRVPVSGVNWMLFGETVGRRVSTGTIARAPERVRPFLWVGSGIRAFQSSFTGPGGPVLDPEAWREVARVAGPEHSARVWQGVGIWWQATLQGRGAPEFLAAEPPESERVALLHGLFTYGDYFVADGLSVQGVNGLGDLIGAFAPRDRGPVMQAGANCLATVQTHGVPDSVLGSGAQAAVSDDRAREYAAGRALYRGTAGRQGIEFWRPASGDRLKRAYDSLQEGSASPELWAGIADAYVLDLDARSPDWVIGGEDGPTALAGELARITEGLAAHEAAALYRAAGRAVARAMTIPFTPIPDPWRWETAIPPDHHAAFREGLAAGSPGSGPLHES